MYEYRALIDRHVDGDTTDVWLDLGLKISRHERLRWYGINAPERYTDMGPVATRRVNELLPAGSDAIVRTIKDDTGKYGRLLAKLWPWDKRDDPTALSCNEILVAEGLAVETDY